MNLTLSLGISNGGGTAKKRKLREGVVDDIGDGGGDRGRVIMRLLQARERMMARLELDDPRTMLSDVAGGGGIRLLHLLLSSVAAGEAGDARAASAALHEVYRRASIRGDDPAQRVAAYFGDALASMLLRSPAVSASRRTTRAEQFLAYTMFYQASPLYQLSHFTANQAIVEAFEAGGGRRLHVVDFDVSYGFQWPSLIQSLSDAAASTSTSSSCDDGDGDEPAVSLRITGFGPNADELRQTEARLVRFASGCPNLRFEFKGVVNGPTCSARNDGVIKTDDDATVVVNLVFPDEGNSRTSTSRECSGTLAQVRSLNPSLVFLVEKHEGAGIINAASRGGATTSLLPRFTASLRYFFAVFDSLHECLPADSAERLAIERNHLGTEISNAIASLDDQHHHHGDIDHASVKTHGHGSSATWKAMMERAGFEGVKLSSRTVSQAKLLLKMKSGSGGFRVTEGDSGRAMSLGWRDSDALITATAWRRRRSRAIDHPPIQLVNTVPQFIR
jgi:hypothetical protein